MKHARILKDMCAAEILRDITGRGYREVRDYIVAKTGLSLRDDRRDEVIKMISERLVSFSGGFDEYFDCLTTGGEEGKELRFLVNRLTVGETHFFRNQPHFEALKGQILPDLIRSGKKSGRCLRIWSAGCSTGEEPYSLAMQLLESIPDIEEWSITLLATDINKESLAAAKGGLYRDWSFRDVEEYYRQRYFTADGTGWKLNQEVMSMVTFRYLNLAENSYPAQVTSTRGMDLIICRNVMIYFKLPLCREITRRFYECLNVGGCLMVGHSEHSDMVHPSFRRRVFGQAIYYQREKEGPYLDKGLKPRFRGSGTLPDEVLQNRTPESEKTNGEQRPADTEETVLFEEGVSRYHCMDQDRALESFRSVLRINSANERARYMAAMVLANKGDFDAAQAELAGLLSVNPLHLEGVYLLALICRTLGDRERELTQLRRAVYINRNFVLGHFQLGVFHLRSSNDGLARRAFLNVLDILRGRADDDVIEGVDGVTVGRLRETAKSMLPGDVPEESRDD